MRKSLLLLFIGLFAVSIHAQTPTATPASSSNSTDVGIKDRLAGGEVKSINQTENKIELSTKDGSIDVILSASTTFKRVPPDNPSLAAAVNATVAEIGVGDKILVTGTVASDKKSVPAKAVYLITKSDIAKRNAAERELWRTRGISGRVVSVDFKTQSVTLATRGMMGETNVTLSPKENANYLRYAPDSVKFSDAIESSLAEIKVGDQLRALGDKSTDGLTFKAEKFVSGSFKMVAGKVTAIDIEKNEITIEDSQTKKPATIVVNSSSLMKKFPPEMAQMMAMRMSGMGMQPAGQTGQTGTTFTVQRPQGSGQPTPPSGQTPPAGTGTPNSGQGPVTFNRPGRGGGEVDDMLERLPSLALADIKVGDTIGVSSTAGAVPNRYTAIKLVSGVEPFLNAPQIQIGGGARGNQPPSINIPGLDGGFGN